ncbi:uncharacterized protein C16orf78 homolog isoform X4 [Trichosurus vulpecula]|uniref:uncharacterized protein C16orf78 homolog isoform X4 n=1 Tax=Trichosurus vulpecula TaxID=9337 RepID=UPI00186AC705|nr:uncharacterized protein C16orf78 homolog isoform X4 [Trichosurus vulpecula]
MPNVVPWSSFSPYISNTSGRPSITSWSRREKRKSIHHGKPTEVTKMSDVKPLYWEPIKQKIGWKGAKERKQSDIAHVIERLEQKQGKSLAVAHKKENNQLFLRKSLKQMKISSEESSLIQEPSYLPSLKEANKKLMGDLDGPEVVMSATPRLSMPRRSSMDPNTNQFIQDTFSSSRKGMTTKVIDPSASLQGYDRKIKNLIEKTPNVKSEITSTLLKPQEVLSCRYLRLSKNNIQTLIRLCREAGMDIDIHPHMNESEMNANRIFNRKPSIAL